MTDLLDEASGLAELRDMERVQPFLDELTAWRPEHDEHCAHCHAAIGELTTALIVKYQLDAVWLLGLFRRLGMMPVNPETELRD